MFPKPVLTKPVIFLGPSLATSEARQLLDADYRPPVQSGDVDALPDGATAGIVDGILEPNLCVGPCEVRRALNRRIALLGAASTGALLAVSLDDPRMTGMGRVYEFITEYPDAGVDLVSVICAEPNWAPLTTPLINVVLSIIDRSNEKGDGELDLDAVIRTLRMLPLAERSSRAILDRLRESHLISPSRLSSLTVRNYKSCDARLLLKRLAAILYRSGPAHS